MSEILLNPETGYLSAQSPFHITSLAVTKALSSAMMALIKSLCDSVKMNKTNSLESVTKDKFHVILNALSYNVSSNMI